MASVYRWYGEFNRGRSSLQDEFREDCPNSVVVPEPNNAVRQLIVQDRHVTYCEIETTITYTYIIGHYNPSVRIIDLEVAVV